MKRSWVFSLLLISLSILNCQNTIYGDMEKSTKIANVYFGFADETGRRVVSTEWGGLKISEPSRITKVIGPGGKVFSIEPLEYRKESSQSNGRQNSINFDYCGGYYSRLIQGKVENGVSCLFVSEDFLKQWHIVKIKPTERDPANCSSAVINVFEKTKKVKVTKSLDLAKYGTSQICFFLYKKTSSSSKFIGDLVYMVNNVIVNEDNQHNQIPFGADGEIAGSFENCRSGLGFSRYCQLLNIFSDGRDTIFLLEDGSYEGTFLNLVNVKNKGFQIIKTVSWYTTPI